MKIGLVLTTINVPSVLSLYRKLGPDVAFFVAGDEKTPADAAMGSDAPHYMSPHYQKSLGYKCSELLGWNNDSRRNIALLEAVKSGAEIIVSVDDDMVPLSDDFFQHIEFTLTQPFSGLKLGIPDYWVDVGQFTVPPYPQRGLPLDYYAANTMSFVHDAEVGVMQGIILGTPDTDAATMASSTPRVHSATDVLRHGLVVEPRAKAVFNSQFTAFRRELAPCFAQYYPWQQRNTDIFASLVARRVMRERNLYTYFGPPFGFHARSERPALNDLKAEMFGLERIAAFDDYLDNYVYPNEAKWTTLDTTRAIYADMPESILPRANIDCALAFLDDMESVL